MDNLGSRPSVLKTVKPLRLKKSKKKYSEVVTTDTSMTSMNSGFPRSSKNKGLMNSNPFVDYKSYGSQEKNINRYDS